MTIDNADNDNRKELIATAIPWVQAKKEGILYNSVPNFIPKDQMFTSKGYLFPTTCYPVSKVLGIHRDRNSRLTRPIIYNRDYVLTAYNELIIRDLSLDNQLVLFQLIKSSYDCLDDTKPSLEHELSKLSDSEKLRLVKNLANQLGKRVINK